MNSPERIIRFGEFTLDPANRVLCRGNAPVELGGRYFDALVLLASAPGELVTKDRLHAEVWRGIPVTDEALSQAIMALRRALGDDAARPRFIETVPRHGYRFVGLVGETEPQGPSHPADKPGDNRSLPMATGGILGALTAGLLVGLIYGSLASAMARGNGVSLVMVLITVCVLAALVSGLGVAGGIALAARHLGGRWWHLALGGAAGGMIVGGVARLIGLDTLRLLLGHAPAFITGAAEGLVMGAVTGGASAVLAWPLRVRTLLPIAGAGGAAGAAIIICGGTLMAGSLAALVSGFPGAALSLAWAQDPVRAAASGAFEGAVFTVLVCAGLARGARINPAP